MDTPENDPKTALINEALQSLIERVRAYGVRLKENAPIKLYVDGMSENPGPMAVGLFARQNEQTLFAENLLCGLGTCNEAEYIALKVGLQLLQSLYSEPASVVVTPEVSATDVKNPASLLARFLRPTDILSEVINTRLSPKMKQAALDPGADALQAGLAEELNEIVHGKVLLDAEGCSKAGVILRPATLSLLQQNPKDMALARLHRLLLEDFYPENIQTSAPIQCHSDSQLVTKQVAGLWRAHPPMHSYCAFLRRMRKTYPYDLRKIDREDNTIADSLAQRYITKNSGRNLTIDDGRFNVKQSTPLAIKRGDLFNAVVSAETKEFLKNHNLRHMLLEVFDLARENRVEEAVQAALDLEGAAQKVLESAPKFNEMLSKWLTNTLEVVKKSISLMVDAIKRGDEPDMAYLVDELSQAESTGSAVFDLQAEMAADGYTQRNDSDLADDGEDD